MQDNFNEGVVHFEVRFAPQLLATFSLKPNQNGLDLQGVLEQVNRGLARATQEYNTSAAVVEGKVPPRSYGIIVCGMRMFLAGMSEYYKVLKARSSTCLIGIEMFLTGTQCSSAV